MKIKTKHKAFKFLEFDSKYRWVIPYVRFGVCTINTLIQSILIFLWLLLIITPIFGLQITLQVWLTLAVLNCFIGNKCGYIWQPFSLEQEEIEKD